MLLLSKMNKYKYYMKQKLALQHILKIPMKLLKYHMDLLKYYQEKFLLKDKDIKYIIKVI